jgi:D-sedoheptulose 7-phosphate isomerase
MDDLKVSIKKYWMEKSNIAQEMTTPEFIGPVEELVEAVIHAYYVFARVFVMGNGGGAAAAEGFAADLSTHPFVPEDKTEHSGERSKLEVHCLSTSPSIITGISNDLRIEDIFVEQLMNYRLTHNDVVIVLSGSGNSQNILLALDYAERHNCKTACISGRGGGAAARMVDYPIVIPGTSTFPGQTGSNDNNFHIEDFQVSISHIVTGLLKEFVNEKFKSY